MLHGLSGVWVRSRRAQLAMHIVPPAAFIDDAARAGEEARFAYSAIEVGSMPLG